MKRSLKLFVTWILTIALMFPGTLIFAEDAANPAENAESAENEYKYSDYIKSIAKNMLTIGLLIFFMPTCLMDLLE